jgi:outer membrane murein-binding lipoprotein Lpp
MLFILPLCIPYYASAASVESQISVLKKQMDELQQKLDEMESQLKKTKEDAAVAQQQSANTQQQVETKMAEVSSRYKVIDDLAKKFGRLKLGGYVRSRLQDGQQQASTFDVTELAFNLRYDITKNISGEFHVWWHPSGNAPDGVGFSDYKNWAGPITFIESAFAEFRHEFCLLNDFGGPVKGTLQVGKFRNFAYGISPTGPDRVYSDYGLFHESNSQSRITGIQYMTKWNRFKANVAVFNGWSLSSSQRFGARPAGIRYLRQNQMNIDDNSNKASSLRLAYAPIEGLETGITGYYQRLSNSDLAAFNAIMGRNRGTAGNAAGNPTDKNREWRTGFDLEYKRGPFHFQSQYFWGEVADVKANWWYAMAGYKLKQFNTDFYVKYEKAQYDQQRYPDINASGAWDRSSFSPLIVYTIHPQVKLFFEYYFEYLAVPSGYNGDTDNNYGFVELILFY